MTEPSISETPAAALHQAAPGHAAPDHPAPDLAGAATASAAQYPGTWVRHSTRQFVALGSLHQGRPIDEGPIFDLLRMIDEREDCADFRAVTVLKMLYAYADLLSPETVAAMRRSILGFKYWMDEPGDDSMCFWSENHQVLFHVCEYLAGQLYPRERFSNDGRTGDEHRRTAQVRLERWLRHRFLYGFTEWLSNTYYEEDVAALAAMVDHCDDAELATRCAIILDLLMLDMALHRFQGYFIASAGRAYEGQKKYPPRADVNDILVAAFGTPDGRQAELSDLHFDRVSATFILSERYEVPAAVRAIAASTDPMTIRTSMGLNLPEVEREIGPRKAVEPTGMFYWLMEAFTTVEAIEVSVKAFRQWGLQANSFLKPMRYISHPLLVRSGILPLVVRLLNPATQGLALERANVTTRRTPHFLLSSAQRYHPGQHGDQQHIWTAALPNRINVFAVHPGAPMFDSNERGFSPAYWVGNGRNPHVAQHGNVLLATYDTRGRWGLLEPPKRARYSHLFFPVDRFDEVSIGRSMLCGRVGDSYIAVLATNRLTQRTRDDFVQEGTVTHYAVILSSRDQYPTLADFVAAAAASPVRVGKVRGRSGRRFQVRFEGDTYELVYRDCLYVNGKPVGYEHPRFDTLFVQADRKPDRLDIACDGYRLELHFDAGLRQSSGPAAPGGSRPRPEESGAGTP